MSGHRKTRGLSVNQVGTLSSDDDEEGGEAGSGVIAPREPGYIDGLFDDSEEDESAVPKKEACKPNKEERLWERST